MRVLSPGALRREVSARNRERAHELPHEQSYGRSATVVYAEDEAGLHGNFLPAVYRRILSNPAWRKRLAKAYTGSAWIAHPRERRRAELECCSSSDALLMNVFCYPRLLWRTDVCGLLGVARGVRAEFGVRAGLPMRGDETDRTELDLRLGDLLVESKLTETGFGTATRERLLRYTEVERVFDVDALPTAARGVAGYQLVRGALAAFHAEARYLLLYDERRADLGEMWFRMLGAMHSSELRSRMLLLRWQELAAVLPPVPREFLAERFGIASDDSNASDRF